MKKESSIELSIFGLSDKESLIYLTLLETGPALVSQIAQKSSLHRPTVYQLLPVLQAKGLITVSPRGKQRRFVAEPPAKLEKLFELSKNNFQQLLPQLEEIHARQHQRPVIKFLEGKQGVEMVLEDLLTTLNRGEVFYRYSSRQAGTEIEKYLPKDFRLRRDNKDIERLVITDELTEHQKKTPSLSRDVKIIPAKSGLFNDNIVQLIYKNRVAFADLNNVSGILIESETMAEFQKKIFKILYSQL